jgi:hypothetical protein
MAQVQSNSQGAWVRGTGELLPSAVEELSDIAPPTAILAINPRECYAATVFFEWAFGREVHGLQFCE